MSEIKPIGYAPEAALQSLRAGVGPVGAWPVPTQCENPVPLFDQAAIDAAVAAERKRCAEAVQAQMCADGIQDNAPLMNAIVAIRAQP